MSTIDPSCAVPPPLKNDTLGEPPYKLCKNWFANICTNIRHTIERAHHNKLALRGADSASLVRAVKECGKRIHHMRMARMGMARMETTQQK
eukprot:CAMPEP_0181294542 /NCGR_PEP_ID=MMETSP1101-20121128/3660_1 /TAXON_ID=46948 /ORGANISM="Rhodomonas abbreviata, Strain Caron Lab Isolate" /LENGTH=90 /DNA_ID=CAMNT_0023399215 /DNA_START=298 /DNA_END=567 /DNA_ORIENTATION=+